MKYISPVYEIVECEVNDVLASSRQFGVSTDDENDKVEFSAFAESIFGF